MTTKIPEPVLPDPLEAAPQPKAKAAKAAPFTVVSTQHLVKSLAVSMEQNRLSRLKNLARTNRDVAWVLAEYQKAPVKKSKKETN